GKAYFLAGGTLKWPIIGLALFSTNISTIHLVGFAQNGYDDGLVYGNYEWMAIFTLVALALFFAPFYIRSQVMTLPDFLERRYSRGCRDWLAALSIVSALFIHIGFTLYTGAVVLKGLFGIPIWYSVVAAAVLTGIYTIVGGLMAVVVTESIQTIILLIGSITITLVAYFKAGGWEGISAHVDPMKLTMLRGADEPSGITWYAVIFGYPIIGLWYWCTDQTIVQRVLGAKDENHARIGPLFAGFIKILPVFIFVLPGTILVALINQGKFAYLDNSADAYAYLITSLLPRGMTGVMAAALLAALMSTVSGALNSVATLFSYDLYKRWKPNASDKSLIMIGRITTFVAMLIVILWTPLLDHFKSIYDGCVRLICYIAPPITAVFVVGIFWKRASSIGALVTLFCGTLMGLTVFLLDWFKDHTGWSVNFMMASFYMCMICIVILGVVSLFKPHTHTPASEKLVWSNPLDALKGKTWGGIGNYKFLSALLIAVIVALYAGFSGKSFRKAENPPQVVAGLNCEYSLGPWKSFPDIRELTFTSRGVAETIDLAYAPPAENYLLKFSGYIDVPQQGKYTFHTKYVRYAQNEYSDDVCEEIKKILKCRLYIGTIMLDLRDVANQDENNLLWEKSGFIRLTPGKHKFTVIYHHRPADEPPEYKNILEIQYQGPNFEKIPIPISALFHQQE
ncbi:sodium/solute symporter, partial [Planctomycetota bacterium]